MLNTVADTVKTTAIMMSLWKHECYRVIADRFTTQEDKEWFEKTIKQTAEEECGAALAAEMQEEPYFVDFLQDAPEPTGGSEKKPWEFTSPNVLWDHLIAVQWNGGVHPVQVSNIQCKWLKSFSWTKRNPYETVLYTINGHKLTWETYAVWSCKYCSTTGRVKI